MAIIIVEKILYPVIPVSQVNNEYFLNPSMHSSILSYTEEFLSSGMIGLMLTFLTLFLCFVFNVDPYGPFRTGIIPITKERFKEEWHKWWKAKNGKALGKILNIVLSLQLQELSSLSLSSSLSSPVNYSKAFGSHHYTIALMLMAPHRRAFTFTRPFQKKAAVILGVYFLSMAGYAPDHMANFDAPSIGMQLQEFEFKANISNKMNTKLPKALLLKLELTDRDIQRLVFWRKIFSLVVVHPMDDQLRFDALISHPFLDLNLEKVCLNKQKTSGFYNAEF